MKSGLLEILCCPLCRKGLELEVFVREGNEIISGLLLCPDCGAYPIKKGIPRFHPSCWEESRSFILKYKEKIASVKRAGSGEELAAFLRRSKETKASFGFEWKRYKFYPEDEEKFRTLFFESTGFQKEEIKGKRVLDVGAGMGRYPRIVASLGAEVVALELSEAVERIPEVCRSLKVFPVQGDLMKPPFFSSSFDFVYSLGVLHHTPSTKKAFFSIARLPKRGGKLAVCVYGKMRREWFNALLRALTTRMPKKLLYYSCLALVPVPKIPLVRELLKPIPYSKASRWQERWNDNFDWYAPPYQHRHSPEEVVSWFQECRYIHISVLPEHEVSVVGERA